ncbi:MAG: transposase [Colwellia sp.]|nr:transposase [Colwellia sp.]
MDYKSIKTKLPNSYFSKEFKIAVIEEYLRTGLPKTHILKKYKVKFQGALQSWMRQYGYEDPYRRDLYAEVNKESNLALDLQQKTGQSVRRKAQP